MQNRGGPEFPTLVRGALKNTKLFFQMGGGGISDMHQPNPHIVC